GGVPRAGGGAGTRQCGLAVAEGDEMAAGDAVVVDQIALDGVGAALGEILVEGVATDGVGVAGDHEGRSLEVRIRKRLAELLHGLRRALADLSRVEVELNLEIDVRLGGRDLRDLLTLAQRERPGVAV